MRMPLVLTIFAMAVLSTATIFAANPRPSATTDFTADWRFHLGEVANGQDPALDDAAWRRLDLPHDWSIEGEFSEKNPATPGGGALPGGIGWYRKSFTLPASAAGKRVRIAFDGVYRNSEVWINGQSLGTRPYGYSSFEYDMTRYVKTGASNVVAVRVDNSEQPNSRWYSGSGIYRYVWLTIAEPIGVDHWGTYVTTPTVSAASATVDAKTRVRNDGASEQSVTLTSIVRDAAGKEVARASSTQPIAAGAVVTFAQTLEVAKPALWTLDRPSLYTLVSEVSSGGATVDRYGTPFGVRTFAFDREKGFSLNGQVVKIRGVCDHHDLGCLGAAINTRALERQLEILKSMGVNGIRTSHNPPAPELLDLCDRMGFVVMDEAFDMWRIKKTTYDYSRDFDAWHERDLTDLVVRDRNHPSVVIWSIGNEIMEQWDPSGGPLAKELAGIVRALDATRPITSAMNEPKPENSIMASGALDLVGLNYHHESFPDFLKIYPGKTFIGTETTSAIATRGHYDMPSDEIQRWPRRWDEPFTGGNPDLTISAYDNRSVPWGSTHEETWKIVKKYPFLSGMFIWTGFDYLGEPTPYPWPARSSYFGIVDLAGFPKDAYYMYQSEWTSTPVLHVFPHWNWKLGQTVDVWAYSNAEEVELFLNGKSLGTKRKQGDELHLMWRVPFEPGALRAVSRTGGRTVLVREVRTAGKPARILLAPDHKTIRADRRDLSFVTVTIVDAKGVEVPDADTQVTFAVSGPGAIAGVDNGLQTSLEPFQANRRKAFNGKCLAVIRSTGARGTISLTATADGLTVGSTKIAAR